MDKNTAYKVISQFRTNNCKSGALANALDEALKALTRTNQAITESSIKEFIEGLNVSEDIKKELRAITPHTYTGL